MTAAQDSRAQFEAWAISEGLDIGRGYVGEVGYGESVRMAWAAWQASLAALSVEPVAVPQGYDSGVQTGNRVTLVFDTQSNASAWFEKFCDDYDASSGTTTIKLPVPAAAAPKPAAQVDVSLSSEADAVMVGATRRMAAALGLCTRCGEESCARSKDSFELCCKTCAPMASLVNK